MANRKIGHNENNLMMVKTLNFNAFVFGSWCRYGSILTIWIKLWENLRSSSLGQQSGLFVVIFKFCHCIRNFHFDFIGWPVREEQQLNCLELHVSR